MTLASLTNRLFKTVSFSQKIADQQRLLQASLNVLQGCDAFHLLPQELVGVLQQGDSSQMSRMLDHLVQMPKVSRVLSANIERLIDQSSLHATVERLSARPPRRYQTSVSLLRPRPYQERIHTNVLRDINQGYYPWLSVVAPMQTGKSTLTVDIVETLHMEAPNRKILVLATSRVTMDQLYEDFYAQFGSQHVGRYDGVSKELCLTTVGSIYTLGRKEHLEKLRLYDFDTVILDEAYMTQTGSVQRILTTLGLGEVVREGKYEILKPLNNGKVLIGYSGTGYGLEGYHESGSLSLLHAMERGWIRDLEAEHQPMVGETTREYGIQGEKMVWWQPTEGNARALAELYADKIHGYYQKNLIFVQTKAAARKLEAALREKCGEVFGIVDSDKDEEENQELIEKWRRGQIEGLISIRKLGPGFRPVLKDDEIKQGVGAVFHTYQTTSPELFTARTGRGWGVVTGIG